MERIKFILDIGVTVFGLLAAFFAVLSFIYGSRIEVAKKIEEQRLKLKVSEANAIAAVAKEEAASALFNAANTNERSKKLELQVETQKERAADAEKELLNLKEKLKPRSISFEKSKRLIDELKEFSLKEISISSPLGDGEAASYAMQFQKIFTEAGWKVDSGIGLSTYTSVGIHIIVKNKYDLEAGRLQKLFKSLGLNLQGSVSSSGVRIQILIGSKNNNE